MALVSGHESRLLDKEDLEKQKKDFKGYKQGLVRLSPGGWIMLTPFPNYADRVYNFKFKPSDVVVMTWAKCGTTWTQEIVWTMQNNPNLDNPKAKDIIINRSPFLEVDMFYYGTALNPKMLEDFAKMCPGKDPNDAPFLTMAECAPEPRTLKTHLPFSLLHPSVLDTAKVVAVLRNPKDAVVSYLHHSRLLKVHDYKGTSEDFVDYFVNDELLYSPYWLHVKEVWEKRGHKNLHIMYFEDMKEDFVGELKKLDEFLATNLSEEQILNIARYTSFSEMQMRANAVFGEGTNLLSNNDVAEKEGGFFRKGEAGDWKNKLTPEMESKIDRWIEKNLNFGVEFKYSK